MYQHLYTKNIKPRIEVSLKTPVIFLLWQWGLVIMWVKLEKKKTSPIFFRFNYLDTYIYVYLLNLTRVMARTQRHNKNIKGVFTEPSIQGYTYSIVYVSIFFSTSSGKKMQHTMSYKIERCLYKLLFFIQW